MNTPKNKMRLSTRVLIALFVLAIFSIHGQPCTLNASFSYSVASGGMASFTSNSTGTITGSTYVWNFGDASAPGSGISPAHQYATGNYNATLTVTNYSGCTSTFTSQVYACALTSTLTQTVTSGGVVLFQVLVSNNLSSLVYAWSFGTSGAQAGSQNQTYTYTSPGTYTVWYVAYDSGHSSCTTTNSTVVVIASEPLSTTSFSSQSPENWQVLPNPSEGIFFIRTPSDVASGEILIYNAFQRLVHRQFIPTRETMMNLSDLQEGIYFFAIVDGSDKVITGKLLIVRP